MLIRNNLQEKVYHPPPPGKGKNAQNPTPNGDAVTAVVPKPTEVQHAADAAAAAAPMPIEVPHAGDAGARQQPESTPKS